MHVRQECAILGLLLRWPRFPRQTSRGGRLQSGKLENGHCAKLSFQGLFHYLARLLVQSNIVGESKLWAQNI